MENYGQRSDIRSILLQKKKKITKARLEIAQQAFITAF